jgi:hypothetical protein
MHTNNRRAPAQRTDHAFKFLIRSNAVTRTTVTIHAEDVKVAWSWLQILFPGSDLSDTEVEQAARS